jgi:hypothetical protein
MKVSAGSRGATACLRAAIARCLSPVLGTGISQYTLCEHVERFLPELFVFVTEPFVSVHNNFVERSVRLLFVARTMCRGTCNSQGSQTRMGFAFPFAT